MAETEYVKNEIMFQRFARGLVGPDFKTPREYPKELEVEPPEDAESKAAKEP